MPESEVSPAPQTSQTKPLAQMTSFERRQHFMQQAAEETARNRQMKADVEKAILESLYDADDPERVEWRPVIKKLEAQFKNGNVSIVWNDLWNAGTIESVDAGPAPNFYRLSSATMRKVQRERDSKKTKK